jgi:hypothetical protein
MGAHYAKATRIAPFAEGRGRINRRYRRQHYSMGKWQSVPQIHPYPAIFDFLGYYPFEKDLATVAGQIELIRYSNGWRYERMAEEFGVTVPPYRTGSLAIEYIARYTSLYSQHYYSNASPSASTLLLLTQFTNCQLD